MKYYRRNNSTETPRNATAAWSMFVDEDGLDQIDSYGSVLWVADLVAGQELSDGYTVWHVSDLQAAAAANTNLVEALEDAGYDADGIIAELDPTDIIDSAGAWDSLEVVQILWDTLCDSMQVGAVITTDGLIVFDGIDAAVVA